jgi:Zn-dependent peptidase ImmA (M78 family)/transcriptional regulator with XRE-family HTH domain
MPTGSHGFNGAKLREAREARQLTGVSLAEIAGITSAMISQYEHGTRTPQPEVLERLARGLNLPIAFFLESDSAPEDDSPLTFRSLSAATKAARTKEDRRFRWHGKATRYISSFVHLPPVTFPNWNLPVDPTELDNDTIERAANQLRRYWNLDEEPIPDVVELLEGHGAVVVRYELGAHELDAYSSWRNGRPHIVLGADKMSAVRSRYDASHELGHLILHRRATRTQLNNSVVLKEAERQAFFFAGAFLLPESTFSEDFGVPTLDALLSLKMKWGVSVAAMIKRAEWLNLITEEQTARLWVAMGRRRWRTREPYDDQISPEEPRTLRTAFEAARQTNTFTIGGLRAALNLPDSDIEQLCGLPSGYLGSAPPAYLMTDENADAEDFQLLQFPQRGT